MPQIPEYDGALYPAIDGDDKLVMDVDGVTYHVTVDELIKRISKLPVDDVAGTTYTILTTDVAREKRFTNASAKTLTIPPTSGFELSIIILVSNRSVTDITIAPDTGVTLNAQSLTIAPNESRVLRPHATNVWDVYGGGTTGDITAPVIVEMEATDAHTIVATFSEEITGDTGFAFSSAGALTVNSVTQTGDNELTFDIDETMTDSEDLGWTYTPGDIEDTSANAMIAASGSVTNSIPPVSYDPDAEAYWEAEELAASITVGDTDREAISDLYVALKAGTNPFATKIKGIFLGYGTGLINGKDLNVTTATNAPAISAAGYTFDGSNDAINTDIVPSTDLSDREAYFLYGKTFTGVTMIGARVSGAGTYIFLDSGGDIIFRLGSASDSTVTGEGGDGRFAIYRKSDTFAKVLKDGVQVFNSSLSAPSPANIPLAFGARNDDGAPFNPVGFQGGIVGGLIVGTDLSDAEASQIDIALGAFITATSRT